MAGGNEHGVLGAPQTERNSATERHVAARQKRQAHVEAILTTDARKKIVVAGPGTGKTFLFRKVLTGKKNSLTLTFVNALVEDLSLELFGLSEVRTLHGFARQQLEKATKRGVPVFPKLSEVLRQDARLLLGRDIDFDDLFHNKVDADDGLRFYATRQKYYEWHEDRMLCHCVGESEGVRYHFLGCSSLRK